MPITASSAAPMLAIGNGNQIGRAAVNMPCCAPARACTSGSQPGSSREGPVLP